MAALSIPKTDQLGLAILRDLSDDVFQSVLAEIERSPSSIPVVDGLSAATAEQLMDAVNSMYRVRAYADVPLEEFASDVCESLTEYNLLTLDQGPRLRERLISVLGSNALNIAAKAVVLLGEHERLFCSARIVTDARPIYGKKVSEPPDAMIITHILKIDYHAVGGSLAEFYIGLGTNDIKELRGVLDRAEEKAGSLQTALAGIKFIDPQQG